MLTGGIWVDVLLLLLLIAAIFAVVRLSRGSVMAADGVEGTGDADFGHDLGTWARGYYPRLVRQAGFDPDRWIVPYWVGKVLFAILLAYGWFRFVTALSETASPMIGIVVLAIAGFFVPDAIFGLLRRGRKDKIRNSVSYFLDLVVALLYSGLSLEEAFRRAGRDGFPPEHPLSREVDLVSQELDAGQDRAVAFRALADRTGVRELRSVAAALRSGAKLGSSVETTLEAQATVMRTKRREELRRRINVALVKALVPVLLCGLPLFLILVFFPAVISVVELFNEFQR